jgi:5-methylcytosine-specific restriction protein A
VQPDHPENVAALCPNCHRKAHYAVNATAFNQGVIEVVRAREGTQK